MKAINPHNNQLIEEFKPFSDNEVNQAIDRSYNSFQKWRKTQLSERKELLKKLAEVMEKHAEEYAKVIALEMGKPIQESVAEVKKAAKHALYCSNNLDNFVKEDEIKTENSKSVVEFHPLGPLFVITPFNFPFWLSIKGSLPALSVGNTIVVKVASACPRTGICLEEAFKEAGFTDEFILIRTSQEQSELVISNKYIRGVSFTGSSKGGSIVASLAGKYQKKSTMELGGNDPLIVLDDGDAELAADIAIASRLRNCGQVCSSAKRYIVHKSKYQEFIEKLSEKLAKQKIGDPLSKDTKVGPLASKKGFEEVLNQIKQSVEQGGKLVYGGVKLEGELKDGNYLQPAIVEVKEDNILFQEEVFGPVFSVTSFETDEDAIRIANYTQYGLAGVIVGKDTERAQAVGKFVDVGNLGINVAVASDSRLPSGGIKQSGYGRECGTYGAREFTNVKTVSVK